MVRLIPTDERFFDLLAGLASQLTASARLLAELLAVAATAERRRRALAQIADVEHAADQLTHDIAVRLVESFVTPFDREDIHRVAGRLDAVVDLVDETARQVEEYRVTTVPPPARQLAGLLVRAAEHLEGAVRSLRDPRTAVEQLRAVPGLEEAGDQVYEHAVGALFRDPPDPLEVLKLKELYDQLEDTLDECHHAAQAVESMAVKYA